MRCIESDDQKREAALRIAIQAGTLSTCPFHDDVTYDGHGDVEAAYKLGNRLFSDDAPLTNVFSSRREMTDYIQSVVNDLSGDYQCNVCAGLT
ncbi:hypothetical protein LZP73_08820 [Shewanella sp. AS16]|uniref:hypothetical protein n=1 Tax=Shewanella sp. AS16 TaxID=2907625 RepID=UPI001F226DDB|nr:hypothetical protein [Shewanella sp. AS16]MCE9686312.1 hypothetical protein [Shewanella sp. AS16]